MVASFPGNLTILMGPLAVCSCCQPWMLAWGEGPPYEFKNPWLFRQMPQTGLL